VDTLSDIAAEVRRDRWTRAPRTEPEIWLDSPAEAPAPVRDTVGSTIADFLDDAQRGRALDSGGRPYTSESLRELRSSMAHIDSELGALPTVAIDNRMVDELLDDLRRKGLSRGRLDSIVIALRALRMYAGGRGFASLTRPAERAIAEPGFTEQPSYADPPSWAERPMQEDRPNRPSPTLELLGTARRVATWTVRSVVFIFAVLVVFLILEL